jgi:hypothetical protein
METGFENSVGGHSTATLPSCGQRVTSAARLAPADLMGRGDAAALPRLDGTAAEYLIAAEDNRAILLAQTMMVLGIAEPGDWERSEHSPSGYILATLKRWIAKHGDAVIRQQFVLYASVASSPDPYAEERIESNLLYLIVSPDSAGYVVIGPTLEQLGAIHPRLPVSFYRLFVGAVRRGVRVYDHEEALDRLELLREYVAGEEDPDQYELPDVEGCIPLSMKEKPLEPAAVSRIAQKAKDETVRRILTASLELDRVSQKLQPAAVSEETREVYMDSNPPLPALLVSFKRHDAITAVFDEESQGMMEAEPEPNLRVEINPGEPASVRQAFSLLGALCETLAAASRLASLLPGNEEA